VRVTNEMADFFVQSVAVEVVECNAKNPTQKDLVVCVNTIVKSACSDQHDNNNSHDKRVNAPIGTRFVASTKKLPHGKVK
jgi:hypothetical protein